MNPWLRLWVDMPNDPKWRTIARLSGQSIGDVIATYLHILINASNASERGRTQNLCAEDIGTAIDLDDCYVQAILDAMQGRVLEGDVVTGWEKRQPKREDGAAERSKQWRENRKQETQTNASERKQTLDKIRVDKIREESKALPASRKAKLPADFYPDETGIKKAENAKIPFKAELERFTDFHRAKGSVMLDWQAAWRTWVSNAVKFSRQPTVSEAKAEKDRIWREKMFGKKDERVVNGQND